MLYANAILSICLSTSLPLTSALEGGGQILPSPHVFRGYKKTNRLIFTSFSVPHQ